VIPNQRIVFNGQALQAFSPNHLIRFYSEIQPFDGSSGVPAGFRRILAADVNFFSGLQYKVNLAFDEIGGLGGLDIAGTEFGCGHLFDVANQTWTRVDRGGNAVQPNNFSLYRSLTDFKPVK